MSFTPEQRMAIEAEGSVAVTAGAGTGKTQMLSERYLYHLTRHRFSTLEIVAVTFTDKAAAELRSRIRQKVSEQLQGSTNFLAEMEAAQISTIHSLAIRICREHPEAAEVPHDFSVLDELDSSLRAAEWLKKGLDALPLEIYDQVPYSLLQVAIKAFLKDPIMAERALERRSDSWAELAADARREALVKLLNNSDWQEVCKTVNSFAGSEGDRIEEARRIAVKAVATLEGGLERGGDPREPLDALNGIDLRGGSKKNWLPGGLETMKEALKVLRELAKEALGEGLLTLKPGRIDQYLASIIPVIRAGFVEARDYVAAAKRRARMLDFADLEDHALRALRDPEVRNYYARRWKAFLVDEFQDTNSVQAEFLEHLTQGTILTIVGDEKQSIYGFRRADVEVFRRFRERILADGGKEVRLATSFRAHAELVGAVNSVSGSLLGSLHQDLRAERNDPPHTGPHLQVYLVQAEKEINKFQRQLAEAKKIASLVREMLDNKLSVHDKVTGRLRSIGPGDIAVLSRAWDPLKIYGDALEALSIPTVHAGGGNLMDTREAKDAWTLLRFLADPADNLALAGLLRSPFFAVSDPLLFTFAQNLPRKASWWIRMREMRFPELERPVQVLSELLQARRAESPSRLLQLADRLSGYTAVIANLSGAARREADWRGFIELVRSLERGTDLFGLARRLKRLIEADVEVPRLPLEAGDTVALMTIHAAKGLEWPMVIVPDLARVAPTSSASVYFDPEQGVALKLESEDGEGQKPVLYTLLEQRQKAREEEEARRMLYVALTRARDRLLLTATDEKGGGLNLLLSGLRAAGILPEFILFNSEDGLPPAPAEPSLLSEPPYLLIGPIARAL